jgi:hypothetical protein
MNEERRNAAAVTLNGKLYVAGGEKGKSVLNSVECYDFKRRQWKVIPPMECKRSGLVLVSLEGKLYAYGGTDGNLIWNSTEFYSTETRRWTMIHSGSMISKRTHMAGTGGETFQIRMSIDKIHLSDRTEIENISALPKERKTILQKSHSSSCDKLNSEILPSMYALGGFDGDRILNSFEMFNIEKKKWITKPSMSVSREWAAACMI